MQKLAILALCAGLAAPVIAQAETTPDGAPPTLGPRQAPLVIQRIIVVEFDSLPSPVQQQVSEAIAATSEDEMNVIRASIGATPEATSALQQKGMNSQEVVATAFQEDGQLALIARPAI